VAAPREEVGGVAGRDSDHPLHVLLVDDDPGDVLITREALAADESRLHIVRDGAAAIDFLRKQGGHEAAPTPDLVLLDLNLPRVSGHEVLASVKSDPILMKIPVIVLTTSDAADDIAASYSGHANAYVTKPVDYDGFVEVVRQIHDFYANVARLPGR
jgi:CheY-like chemotaxis protein